MSNLTLRFLGHSAFHVRFGNHDVLIDPHIGSNPAAREAGIRPEEFSPTHIVLTHAHGDHLGDTIAIAKRSKSVVIATFELANYVESEGCTAMGMGIGGAADLGFGRIKFTIAHHSSSTPDGRSMGNPAGVLLFIGGATLYHAGDTALFGDMELIGRRHAIDVALLPIGDFFTMGIDDAVESVRMLNPQLAIPMHFNTYPPIRVDAGLFVKGVEALGRRARILSVGEEMTVEVERPLS